MEKNTAKMRRLFKIHDLQLHLEQPYYISSVYSVSHSPGQPFHSSSLLQPSAPTSVLNSKLIPYCLHDISTWKSDNISNSTWPKLNSWSCLPNLILPTVFLFSVNSTSIFPFNQTQSSYSQIPQQICRQTALVLSFRMYSECNPFSQLPQLPSGPSHHHLWPGPSDSILIGLPASILDLIQSLLNTAARAILST